MWMTDSPYSYLRQLFSSCDRRGDGKAVRGELIALLRRDPEATVCLGLSPGTVLPGTPEGEQYEALFRKLSSEREAYITWDEFEEKTEINKVHLAHTDTSLSSAILMATRTVVQQQP